MPQSEGVALWAADGGPPLAGAKGGGVGGLVGGARAVDAWRGWSGGVRTEREVKAREAIQPRLRTFFNVSSSVPGGAPAKQARRWGVTRASRACEGSPRRRRIPAAADSTECPLCSRLRTIPNHAEWPGSPTRSRAQGTGMHAPPMKSLFSGFGIATSGGVAWPCRPTKPPGCGFCIFGRTESNLELNHLY